MEKFKSKNLSAFDAVYSDNFPEIIYTNKKHSFLQIFFGITNLVSKTAIWKFK